MPGPNTAHPPRVPERPEPCDVVAFMAHPDDAELGCGGTLALAVKQGYRASVVDFTRGEMGSRGTAEGRALEAAAAAEVLGLACRVNLGLPDAHLHDSDEQRGAVVRLLRAMRPRVVIAPPRDDHHPDHVAVARIVDASLHLSAVAKYCPELPSWRPHVLLHTLGSRLQSPQLVVDITEVYELRRRAILCHSSQLHREGSTEVETRIAHPLFLDWVDGALRRWGYLIGRPYGEGFTCAGPVPVLDLVGQYAKAPWEHPPRKD